MPHNTMELINRHRNPLREGGSVVVAGPGVVVAVPALEPELLAPVTGATTPELPDVALMRLRSG